MVKSRPPKRWVWIGWVWIGMVFGLFTILGSWGWVLRFVMLEATNLTKTGLAGDTFGALNALFTGLSSFGVLVAIFLQGQELHESRIAQQDAAIAMQEQLKASRLQSDIGALREIIPLLEAIEKEEGRFSTMSMERDDPIRVAVREIHEEKARYEYLLLQKIREHFKDSIQQ